MKGSQRWAWCAVALLAAGVVMLGTVGPATREFATLAGLLLLVAFVGARERKAEARVEGDGTWEVHVNGVAVGSISGPNYLRLKRAAYRDPNNALDQVVNAVSVVATLLRKQLVAIPVTLFWCAVLLTLARPDLAATALDTLRAGVMPAQLADAIAPMLAVYVVTVVVLAFLVVFAFGCDLGFRNRYDEAIRQSLRRYCKTPATGDVQLYRPTVNPGAHVPAVAASERN